MDEPGLFLSELWIYPVKSLGGFRVPQAYVTEAGLAGDRRWMITDTEGRFLTQREVPGMSLIQATIELEGLGLRRTDGMASVVVPDHVSRGDLVAVRVWDDEVPAHRAEQWVNVWLSEQLGRAVCLVRLCEHSHRSYVSDGVPRGALSFSDDHPYHMITQSSLDDLNLRMDEAIGVERFRPNLVIAGTAPYEDDRWGQIRVGGITFEVASRCERCVMVNVGEGHVRKQPLRTLATYRRQGRFTYFGQNIMAISHGAISQGDAVIASYR